MNGSPSRNVLRQLIAKADSYWSHLAVALQAT